MDRDIAMRLAEKQARIFQTLGRSPQTTAPQIDIGRILALTQNTPERIAEMQNSTDMAAQLGRRWTAERGGGGGNAIGPPLSPLEAERQRTAESMAAAKGAGVSPPGGGFLSTIADAAGSLKDVGLKTAGFLGQQYSRLSNTLPAAAANSLKHMAQGEKPWETVDDLLWAGAKNAWSPGSVPNTGGDVVNEYSKLSDRLIESGNPFSMYTPPVSPIGKLLEEKGIVKPAGDIKLGSPSTYTNALNPTRAAEIGTGLLIDVGADPLSWFSLGGTTVLKAGSDEAVEATMRAAAEQAGLHSHLPETAQNAIRNAGTKQGTEAIAKEMETVSSGARRGTKKLSETVVKQKVKEEANRISQEIVQEGKDWIEKNIKKYKGKVPKKGPYRDLWEQATQATDNEISQGILEASKVEARRTEILTELLNEYASQFLPDIENAVRRVYDPLLKRRVDVRLGLLGRGKSIAESTLASKAASSQGKVASGLRKYLGDNPVSDLMENAYKPIGALGNYNRSTRLGQMALNAFSPGEIFPSKINQIRQATKAAGIRAYDLARKGGDKMPEFIRYGINPKTGKTAALAKVVLEPWKQLFKGVDNDLAKEIYSALEDGRVMSGTTKFGRPLKEVQQGVRDWLDYVKQERLDLGLMKPGEVAEDFLPIKMNRVRKGELQDLVNKIKGDRKREIAQNGKFFDNTASSLAAKHPELTFNTDIREVLGDYYAKHQRDLVRHRWRSEMLNGYSIPAAKMDDSVRNALNLKQVAGDYVPESMKGLDYYMTKDMAKVMDDFEKLWKRSTSSLDEVKELQNGIESANRAWKIGATVARPAFQLRNAIGDVATGWLDQVPNWKYAKYAKAKLEGPGGVLFEAGGKKYTVQEMDDRFLEHAGASTYYNTGSLNDKLGNKVANKVMDFNEARESLPRKVQYSHAFEDEMRKQVKEYQAKFGGRNPIGKKLREMEDKAQAAAVSRVNKFKFDYSELTPFEAQWMRNVFPFYTFQKKATQMVLENALLNPGRLSAMNKTISAIQAQLSGDPNDEWLSQYDQTIPDWAKEMGFVPTEPLSGNGDVWGFNTSVLPQSVVSQLLSGETNQDLWQNVVGMANPLVQLPFEQATGEDIGTGIPQDTSLKGLMDYVPPVDTLAKIASVAGWEGASKWLGNKTAGEKPTALSIAELFGAPVQRVSEEQRVYAQKDVSDPYETAVGKVNQNLQEHNLEVKTVTKTKGGQKVKTYRVQTDQVDPQTGERTVYKEFESRSDAYAYAVSKAKE